MKNVPTVEGPLGKTVDGIGVGPSYVTAEPLCDQQMEVNKKREAELQRLRRDLEESCVQSEAVAASLRKRHGEVVAELSEQCEALQRTRAKLEKEKQNLRMEVDDLGASLESLQKGKVRTSL